MKKVLPVKQIQVSVETCERNICFLQKLGGRICVLGMTSIVSKRDKNPVTTSVVAGFLIVAGFKWPRPPSLAASQQFTLRPLRKHAGCMFLGRSRIHRFLNAPGTGVGRKRSWSQDCRMVEISIVSKSYISLWIRYARKFCKSISKISWHYTVTSAQ